MLQKLGVDVARERQHSELLFGRLRQIFRRKRECDGDEACIAKQSAREGEERRALQSLAKKTLAKSWKKLKVRRKARISGFVF